MNRHKPFEFWFDFASTYTYPAVMRIESLLGEEIHQVRWRPFLLGAIFKSQGWETSPFLVFPAKGRYMWRDIERTCAALDIPFRRPSGFPRNGLLAARIVCANESESWVPDFIRGVFTANFAEDRDIADTAIIAELLERLGLNAGTLIAQTQMPDVKQRLREQTERAEQLDLFGAPTFLVNDEMFWGNDRLEQAVRWWRDFDQTI